MRPWLKKTYGVLYPNQEFVGWNEKIWYLLWPPKISRTKERETKRKKASIPIILSIEMVYVVGLLNCSGVFYYVTV